MKRTPETVSGHRQCSHPRNFSSLLDRQLTAETVSHEGHHPGDRLVENFGVNKRVFVLIPARCDALFAREQIEGIAEPALPFRNRIKVYLRVERLAGWWLLPWY